jgi:hypothetical protein
MAEAFRVQRELPFIIYTKRLIWPLHMLSCAQPEGYLNDSVLSSVSANFTDPYTRDHWVFGAGRRICPSILVAEHEIWLTISRILWAFNMAQIPGKPVDLKEYDGLSGRNPVPFEIKLKERVEGDGKIIQAQMEPAFAMNLATL